MLMDFDVMIVVWVVDNVSVDIGIVGVNNCFNYFMYL